MSEIDICICTFRRPHIADTLRSIAALTNKEMIARVIIADNDDTPTAKTLVEETAADTGLNITYIHAPARNISIARNACLDAAAAPLVVFIDDDEMATPGWLAGLYAALQGDVDAVLGAVDAIYPQAGWMREADTHSTRPVFVAGKIITGYTCNVLFRRDAPAFSGLRFRIELGRSGGEDTVFFSEAYRKGARIAYAPEAIVTELVTPERLSFSWLVKRRFRAGQTHGLLLLEDDRSSRIENSLKAAAKAIFCSSVSLIFFFSPVQMKQWILRGALHMGVIARLLGKSTIEQY